MNDKSKTIRLAAVPAVLYIEIDLDDPFPDSAGLDAANEILRPQLAGFSQGSSFLDYCLDEPCMLRLDLEPGKTYQEDEWCRAQPETPPEQSNEDKLRAALKECLGIVDAWKSHLSDIGKDKASKTVDDVHARALAAYNSTRK